MVRSQRTSRRHTATASVCADAVGGLATTPAWSSTLSAQVLNALNGLVFASVAELEFHE